MSAGNQTRARAGVLYALAAFLCWGFNPFYFKSVEEVSSPEVLGHRIVWSMALAPYQVIVVPLNVLTEEIMQAAGVDVLLDDRDQRAGVKFKDADLIGIPLRVVVGDRGLKEGKVEYQGRRDTQATTLAADDVSAFLAARLSH